MNGTILSFDYKEQKGLIRGSDEGRYYFSISDWSASSKPVVGNSIDFIIKDGKATEIYLLNASNVKVTEKSKPIATLLAIYLGGFGIHKFYLGNWGWGLIYLLTCWLYIPFLVASIEGIKIIFLTDEQFAEKSRDAQAKGPFGFLW